MQNFEGALGWLALLLSRSINNFITCAQLFTVKVALSPASINCGITATLHAGPCSLDLFSCSVCVLPWTPDASLFILKFIGDRIELRIASPDGERTYHWGAGSKAARSLDTFLTIEHAHIQSRPHSITVCRPCLRPHTSSHATLTRTLGSTSYAGFHVQDSPLYPSLVCTKFFSNPAPAPPCCLDGVFFSFFAASGNFSMIKFASLLF